MNWFKKHEISNLDMREWDMCEHVEANHALAYEAISENDSFGIVDKIILCKACVDSDEELHENKCTDCGAKAKDMREWRWFDFYAAQGDTPLYICKECWSLEKHSLRRQKDREEYRQEMDY